MYFTRPTHRHDPNNPHERVHTSSSARSEARISERNRTASPSRFNGHDRDSHARTLSPVRGRTRDPLRQVRDSDWQRRDPYHRTTHSPRPTHTTPTPTEMTSISPVERIQFPALRYFNGKSENILYDKWRRNAIARCEHLPEDKRTA